VLRGGGKCLDFVSLKHMSSKFNNIFVASDNFTKSAKISDIIIFIDDADHFYVHVLPWLSYDYDYRVLLLLCFTLMYSKTSSIIKKGK